MCRILPSYGPGSLQRAGAPDALVEYVRMMMIMMVMMMMMMMMMMMRVSWFTTGARPGIVQHTGAGMVPGTY